MLLHVIYEDFYHHQKKIALLPEDLFQYVNILSNERAVSLAPLYN